jgi:hypothetical protein
MVHPHSSLLKPTSLLDVQVRKGSIRFWLDHKVSEQPHDLTECGTLLQRAGRCRAVITGGRPLSLAIGDQHLLSPAKKVGNRQ